MLKIRRYYGYDCNSIQGFNDGRYIDADFVEVPSLDAAFEACKTALRDAVGVSYECGNTIPLVKTENGFEAVTGYYDTRGNPLTHGEYLDLCDDDDTAGSYRYQYVNFEIVE